MSKWLSIELSLLLLVSLVAFAGFVGMQDSSNNLTGELSFYKPAPKPSCPTPYCPKATCPTCPAPLPSVPSNKSFGFVTVFGSNAPASDVSFATKINDLILYNYIKWWNMKPDDVLKNGYLKSKLDTEITLSNFGGKNYFVIKNGQIHFSAIDSSAPSQDVAIVSEIWKMYPSKDIKRSKLTSEVTVTDFQ